MTRRLTRAEIRWALRNRWFGWLDRELIPKQRADRKKARAIFRRMEARAAQQGLVLDVWLARELLLRRKKK